MKLDLIHRLNIGYELKTVLNLLSESIYLCNHCYIFDNSSRRASVVEVINKRHVRYSQRRESREHVVGTDKLHVTFF